MKLSVEVPTHPLPGRRGLSWLTSKWGMCNFKGKNALNAYQLQTRKFSDHYGGIRLARAVMMGEP